MPNPFIPGLLHSLSPLPRTFPPGSWACVALPGAPADYPSPSQPPQTGSTSHSLQVSLFGLLPWDARPLKAGPVLTPAACFPAPGTHGSLQSTCGKEGRKTKSLFPTHSEQRPLKDNCSFQCHQAGAAQRKYLCQGRRHSAQGIPIVQHHVLQRRGHGAEL